MSREEERAEIIRLAVGFVSFLYGLLLMTFPERYLKAFPPWLAAVLGVSFVVVGFLLILRREWMDLHPPKEQNGQ